jgi:hypothetical protein
LVCAPRGNCGSRPHARYFAIDNHVPVYPWNNLASAGSQRPSTLAGWIPGLFTIWALARGSRWGITFGAGWTVVWLLLQVRQWWLPYLFGPTPLHATPEQLVSTLHMFLDRPRLDTILASFAARGWTTALPTGEVVLLADGERHHATILAQQQIERTDLGHQLN